MPAKTIIGNSRQDLGNSSVQRKEVRRYDQLVVDRYGGDRFLGVGYRMALGKPTLDASLSQFAGVDGGRFGRRILAQDRTDA